MHEKREPIGYVEATVRFKLYEGDKYEDSKFPWFEYAEPGIYGSELACCRRECETVGFKVVVRS